MAQLYANENFPKPVVLALRRLGHDVLTIQETGFAERAASDDVILAFARGEKRALLSLNRRHFVRLHGIMPDHAGIIVTSLDLDGAAWAEHLDRVIRENEPLAGKLLRVNRPG
ncbi:MAG: DUF5615 family PIN-like protein [Coprothermobacterota bacterium]|nr:DUF5615 family PIN-like protein [Coprothermobacterota bacterium]